MKPRLLWELCTDARAVEEPQGCFSQVLHVGDLRWAARLTSMDQNVKARVPGSVEERNQGCV